MKKRLIVMTSLLFLIGCTNVKVPLITEQEKLIKEYAFRVFEEEIKPDLENQSGMKREVTISMIKNLNLYGRMYDLTPLSNCTDSSSVFLTINDETKEIVHYEINLNCKQN
jgi:hypothetical protein